MLGNDAMKFCAERQRKKNHKFYITSMCDISWRDAKIYDDADPFNIENEK